MPLIPDYNPNVPGTLQPVAPSTGAAMAPGRALQQAGQGIASAAGAAMDVQHVRQSRIDQAAKNRARLSMQQAFQEHELFRAKNPDESTWAADAASRAAKVREGLQGERLSPSAREELDTLTQGWGSSFELGAQTDVEKHRTARGRTEQTQLVEACKRDGRFGDARAVMREGVASGLFHPDEMKADEVELQTEEKEFREREVEKAEMQTIAADPAGWWEKHSATPPEGMDAVKYQRFRVYAKARLHERTVEDADTIEDAMAAGKITTPEQIDRMGEDLRPVVREQLKATLARRQAADFEARMNTPEHRQEVVGKVSGLLKDYRPADEGFDAKYVEIAGLIGDLPPGAVREELDRQLNAVRNGRATEVKSHAAAAYKALDAAAERGQFGNIPETEPQAVSRLISAGFLSDVDKLTSLGLSEAAAKRVAEAGGEEAKTPADRHKAQVAAFRELAPYWHLRGERTASGFDRAAAEAILNGKESVAYTSPEAEDARISAIIERDQAYGEAKEKLAEFLKVNPDATPQQIDDKILEIAGERTHRELKSGIYQRKETSGGPKGASDDTAAVPVGEDLTAIVKNFEASSGFHRAAYWDYGQWSIGYGTKAKKGEVIDEAEADRRLAAELAMHRARVEKVLGKTGMRFAPHEVDALTSFDFNTGAIEQLTANGTRSKAEIAAAMPLYRNADGQRLRGLENRRRAELALFLNGYGSAVAKNDGEFSEFNVIQ